MQLDTARITQDRRAFDTKDADLRENLILLLDPRPDFARLPYGTVIKARLTAAKHKLEPAAPFHTQLPNWPGTRLTLWSPDPATSTFELLATARRSSRPIAVRH